MPLIGAEVSGPKERPPWRGVVVGTAAAAVFIVVLALVARATRDSAGGVPHEPDAVVAMATGFDGGTPLALGAFVDGGAAVTDAGETSTVEPEPDTGPASVAGPPIDVEAVSAEVLPIVEKCLQGALRFDPSLGGSAHIDVSVRAGAIEAHLRDSTSPVLMRCVADNARALPWQGASSEVVRLEIAVLLDGLRGRVKVKSAELVHVAPGRPPEE